MPQNYMLYETIRCIGFVIRQGSMCKKCRHVDRGRDDRMAGDRRRLPVRSFVECRDRGCRVVMGASKGGCASRAVDERLRHAGTQAPPSAGRALVASVFQGDSGRTGSLSTGTGARRRTDPPRVEPALCGLPPDGGRRTDTFMGDISIASSLRRALCGESFPAMGRVMLM